MIEENRGTIEESSEVLVVGGGVVGLCSAYFLSEAGCRVTVVDRDVSQTENCSAGCAGMVVPSHFIPLAAPGAIGQGLKWMLSRKSPFHLKPRADLDLVRWCWEFFRHSNARHVANSRELLRDLALESRRLFVVLAEEGEFGLTRRGLLTLCQTEAGLEEEVEVVAMANELGVRAEVCGPERLAELDPDVTMNVRGGVWFEQDCHLDPIRFLKGLRDALRKRGVQLIDGEVGKLNREGERLAGVALADGRQLGADAVVVAAGVWTTDWAKSLGLRLPMQGGKGYSVDLPAPREMPKLCSILKEGRVAVTPMGDRLRVAGTMEICGHDRSVDRHRFQGVVESFCRFYPAFEPADFSGLKPWAGLRPCSPDGLPFIGRVPDLKNVVVATGHSMLGLSLGPVTGQLVSELVRGVPTAIPIDALAPDRF